MKTSAGVAHYVEQLNTITQNLSASGKDRKGSVVNAISFVDSIIERGLEPALELGHHISSNLMVLVTDSFVKPSLVALGGARSRRGAGSAAAARQDITRLLRTIIDRLHHFLNPKTSLGPFTWKQGRPLNYLISHISDVLGSEVLVGRFGLDYAVIFVRLMEFDSYVEIVKSDCISQIAHQFVALLRDPALLDPDEAAAYAQGLATCVALPQWIDMFCDGRDAIQVFKDFCTLLDRYHTTDCGQSSMKVQTALLRTLCVAMDTLARDFPDPVTSEEVQRSLRRIVDLWHTTQRKDAWRCEAVAFAARYIATVFRREPSYVPNQSHLRFLHETLVTWLFQILDSPRIEFSFVSTKDAWCYDLESLEPQLISLAVIFFAATTHPMSHVGAEEEDGAAPGGKRHRAATLHDAVNDRLQTMLRSTPTDSAVIWLHFLAVAAKHDLLQREVRVAVSTFLSELLIVAPPSLEPVVLGVLRHFVRDLPMSASERVWSLLLHRLVTARASLTASVDGLLHGPRCELLRAICSSLPPVPFPASWPQFAVADIVPDLCGLEPSAATLLCAVAQRASLATCKLPFDQAKIVDALARGFEACGPKSSATNRRRMCDSIVGIVAITLGSCGIYSECNIPPPKTGTAATLISTLMMNETESPKQVATTKHSVSTSLSSFTDFTADLRVALSRVNTDGSSQTSILDGAAASAVCLRIFLSLVAEYAPAELRLQFADDVDDADAPSKQTEMTHCAMEITRVVSGCFTFIVAALSRYPLTDLNWLLVLLHEAVSLGHAGYSDGLLGQCCRCLKAEQFGPAQRDLRQATHHLAMQLLEISVAAHEWPQRLTAEAERDSLNVQLFELSSTTVCALIRALAELPGSESISCLTWQDVAAKWRQLFVQEDLLGDRASEPHPHPSRFNESLEAFLTRLVLLIPDTACELWMLIAELFAVADSRFAFGWTQRLIIQGLQAALMRAPTGLPPFSIAMGILEEAFTKAPSSEQPKRPPMCGRARAAALYLAPLIAKGVEPAALKRLFTLVATAVCDSSSPIRVAASDVIPELVVIIAERCPASNPILYVFEVFKLLKPLINDPKFRPASIATRTLLRLATLGGGLFRYHVISALLQFSATRTLTHFSCIQSTLRSVAMFHGYSDSTQMLHVDAPVLLFDWCVATGHNIEAFPVHCLGYASLGDLLFPPSSHTEAEIRADLRGVVVAVTILTAVSDADSIAKGQDIASLVEHARVRTLTAQDVSSRVSDIATLLRASFGHIMSLLLTLSHARVGADAATRGSHRDAAPELANRAIEWIRVQLGSAAFGELLMERSEIIAACLFDNVVDEITVATQLPFVTKAAVSKALDQLCRLGTTTGAGQAKAGFVSVETMLSCGSGDRGVRVLSRVFSAAQSADLAWDRQRRLSGIVHIIATHIFKVIGQPVHVHLAAACIIMLSQCVALLSQARPTVAAEAAVTIAAVYSAAWTKMHEELRKLLSSVAAILVAVESWMLSSRITIVHAVTRAIDDLVAVAEALPDARHQAMSLRLMRRRVSIATPPRSEAQPETALSMESQLTVSLDSSEALGDVRFRPCDLIEFIIDLKAGSPSVARASARILRELVRIMDVSLLPLIEYLRTDTQIRSKIATEVVPWLHRIITDGDVHRAVRRAALDLLRSTSLLVLHAGQSPDFFNTAEAASVSWETAVQACEDYEAFSEVTGIALCQSVYHLTRCADDHVAATNAGFTLRRMLLTVQGHAILRSLKDKDPLTYSKLSSFVTDTTSDNARVKSPTAARLDEPKARIPLPASAMGISTSLDPDDDVIWTVCKDPEQHTWWVRQLAVSLICCTFDVASHHDDFYSAMAQTCQFSAAVASEAIPVVLINLIVHSAVRETLLAYCGAVSRRLEALVSDETVAPAYVRTALASCSAMRSAYAAVVRIHGLRSGTSTKPATWLGRQPSSLSGTLGLAISPLRLAAAAARVGEWYHAYQFAEMASDREPGGHGLTLLTQSPFSTLLVDGGDNGLTDVGRSTRDKERVVREKTAVQVHRDVVAAILRPVAAALQLEDVQRLSLSGAGLLNSLVTPCLARAGADASFFAAGSKAATEVLTNLLNDSGCWGTATLLHQHPSLSEATLAEARAEAAWRSLQWSGDITLADNSPSQPSSDSVADSPGGFHATVWRMLRIGHHGGSSNRRSHPVGDLLRLGMDKLLDSVAVSPVPDLVVQCQMLRDAAHAATGSFDASRPIIEHWSHRAVSQWHALLNIINRFADPGCETDSRRRFLISYARVERQQGRVGSSFRVLTDLPCNASLLQNETPQQRDKRLLCIAKTVWSGGETERAVHLLGSSAEARPSGEIILRLCRWARESGAIPPSTLVKEWLPPLVANAQNAEVSAKATFLLASWADELFRNLCDMMYSTEALAYRSNIEAARASQQELQRRLQTDGPSLSDADKRHLSVRSGIMERDLHREEEEHIRNLGDCIAFRDISMHEFARYLASCSDGKHDTQAVFRLVGVWFAPQIGNLFGDWVKLHRRKKNASTFSREVISEASGRLLSTIPPRKFVPALPQLAVRLGSQSDPVNERILVTLVTSIVAAEPQTGFWPILALANGQQFSEVEKNVHSVDTAKIQAAREVLNALKSNAQIAPTLIQMEMLSSAYLELAFQPIDKKRDRGTRSFTLSPQAKISAISHLTLVNVPTSSDPSVGFVDRFVATFDLVGGVNNPKLLQCISSTGATYRQLLKNRDDLRQDAIIEQFFAVCNSELRLHAGTRSRDISMRTYRVVPLAPTSGLIEWIDNTLTLVDYLVGGSLPGAHSRWYPSDLAHDECRNRMAQIPNTASAQTKLAAYREVCSQFHPALHYFTFEMYASPLEALRSRFNYVKSVAAGSMLGYLVGLGDRHSGNALLDMKTGELIQIDLGLAFEQGAMQPVPERIPFRLTRDVVDGMGMLGLEGPFKIQCAAVLGVMRNCKQLLSTVLETFVHDPLAKWAISFPVDQQGPRRATKQNSDDANRALARARDKLKGYEGGEHHTVASHVMKLIQTATDESLLSQLYAGWAAWL